MNAFSMHKMFHFSEKIVSLQKKTVYAENTAIRFYGKKIIEWHCASSVHIYFEIETGR